MWINDASMSDEGEGEKLGEIAWIERRVDEDPLLAGMRRLVYPF